MTLLAFSQHAGTRVAEVGFLLILISGIWLTVAELGSPKWFRLRRDVASIALALAGALLIVAVHWGHFGH
jgi:hypothetical protein